MSAYLDDFGKITVWINRNFYGGKTDWFCITGDHGYCTDLIITGVEDHGDQIRYDLTCPILDFGASYMVREQHGLSVPLIWRMIVNTKQFNDRFTYEGHDLGSTYHQNYTEFALWAPTAVSVTLRVRISRKLSAYPMVRGEKGVWRIRVSGDLKHATYTYLIERNGAIAESVDPYAYSSTGNGRESAVIDLDEIRAIRDYPVGGSPLETDAVIYEANVRDMTSNPFTGTKTNGLFSSLSETGTSYRDMPTGLSYLVSLGVTHVQLMPVLDFSTVDEFHPQKTYNWGYDPMHYLVPEGSYSSDPDDPYARVRELRTLITTMHREGLRVNLDVVFNHVYDVTTSPFEAILPYYYFRYNERGYLSNGTFCGNDFASEKPMVRMYIIDVIRALMHTYGVDGFRFDLMGILDVDTMNEIRSAAKRIKGSAMIYGEGWDMPTTLDGAKKASILNQSKMPGIGHFNDYFRDVVKGKTSDDQKYDRGYVTGDLGQSFNMLSALSANVLSTPYFKRFDSPEQSINALETHDNNTVWDKMHFCCGNEDRNTRMKRQKMLIASALCAQGVPFIHAGMEYCGTKNDNSNSYNSGDEINQMNWQRAVLNSEVVDYTKKCIAMRRKYAAFRLRDAKEIEESLHLSVSDGGVVFYDIEKKDPQTSTELMRVIINPTFDERYYHFEPGWHIVLDRNGNESYSPTSAVVVPPLTVIVCAR